MSRDVVRQQSRAASRATSVAPAPTAGGARASVEDLEVILSFDVEEHFRIEAAAGLPIDPALRDHYSGRVAPATHWLLDRLAERGILATFFVVGQVAHSDPGLVRAIHRAGHEVASHGWDHRRVLEMTPRSFGEDVRRSTDAIEQAIGAAVVGYRAPTFSVMRRTAWALDVLSDLGLLYDSSIYPVRHDRYGIPGAPRAPFLARGAGGEILEFPPATLRVMGTNVPVGGGGYFRLLPPALLERAIGQVRHACRPAVAMLYFHPWEFDPGQPHLPLGRLNRFRTYVGIGRSRDRLGALLAQHRFARAVDVALGLHARRQDLAEFRPGG
jgi:polysaccharide deacetylase family protein (PEP-CTERM system associated)